MCAKKTKKQKMVLIQLFISIQSAIVMIDKWNLIFAFVGINNIPSSSSNWETLKMFS